MRINNIWDLYRALFQYIKNSGRTLSFRLSLILICSKPLDILYTLHRIKVTVKVHDVEKEGGSKRNRLPGLLTQYLYNVRKKMYKSISTWKYPVVEDVTNSFLKQFMEKRIVINTETYWFKEMFVLLKQFLLNDLYLRGPNIFSILIHNRNDFCCLGLKLL